MPFHRLRLVTIFICSTILYICYTIILFMTFEIEIDEKTDQAKNVFKFLDQNQIKYNPKKLTAKDAAFGIGRPATDDELAEYLNRCMLSETLDLNKLIDETKS